MFIDRNEFGRRGDFSGMSEDELDKRIRELAASEEAWNWRGFWKRRNGSSAIACGGIGTTRNLFLASA
jgi:hypothetical protein